jgi:mycothiol synthase
MAALDAFLQRYERAIGVLPDSHLGFFQWRWRQPYVDLDRDSFLVEHHGRIVASALGFVEPGSPILQAAARVDQEHVAHGLGSAMLTWVEARAALGDTLTIRTQASPEDAAGIRLLRSRGYREVRTGWDMGVDLRGDEVAPPPSGGVTIRPAEPGEERTLFDVAVPAFRDHWDHAEDPTFERFLLDWYGGENPVHALVAERDGEAVGVLGWDDGVDAYVFNVAVLREHRGRGVARALLARAIADAAARGHRHLSLSVDAQNPTGATTAYERAGLRVLRSTTILDKELEA